MPPSHPGSKALLGEHYGTMMVNNALVKPYFLGGWHWGVPFDSQKCWQVFLLTSTSLSSKKENLQRKLQTNLASKIMNTILGQPLWEKTTAPSLKKQKMSKQFPPAHRCFKPEPILIRHVYIYTYIYIMYVCMYVTLNGGSFWTMIHLALLLKNKWWFVNQPD